MDQQPAFINYLPSKESDGVKPISYQGLLSLIKEAIMILGPDATILYMNQKADDIFHRLYGTRYSERCSLFHLLPQPRHGVIAAILERCWQGETLEYDTEVMRGAQSFWINCRYVPLYEDGVVRCISVVIEDIKSKKELEREERKRREAEQALDESKLLFQLFMEHAPLRAWITDRDGYIRYMNQQYEQAFGFDMSSRNKSIFDLFPRDWAEEYYQEIQKVLALNKPCEKISEGRNKDGTAGLFRVTRFPLPVGGETMVAGWAVEITEQVQLQKKLLLEARNKKRQIIRSIIEAQEKERRELSVELHDNVNQILSSCQLMLEVARDKKDLSQRLTEKAYESLKTAISEIRRISHELNPSAIEDLGLSEAISEMADKINSAGKLRIYFNYREYGRQPAIAMTDKIAVYRIVQEQLNNIIKHAQASEVHITLYYKLARLYLHIEDDGIGFDIKQVKKGLGLKNIQHRVAYYQGRLKIDTAQGRGCKLKVLLSIPA